MGKKNLSLLLVLALVLGCTVTTTANAKKKPKMKLNKTSLTLRRGKGTKKLKVSNPTRKVKWSSSDRRAVALRPMGKKDSECLVMLKIYTYSKEKITKKKLTVTAKVGKKKFTCKVTIKPNKTLTAEEKYEAKIKTNFEKLEKFIDNDPESEKHFSGEDGRLVSTTVSKKNQKYTFSICHSFGEERWIHFEISQNEADSRTRSRNSAYVYFCEDDNWLICGVVAYFANDVRIQVTNWYAYGISASNNILFEKDIDDPEYYYAKESEIKLANEMLDTAYPAWQKLLGKYGMKMKDLGFS